MVYLAGFASLALLITDTFIYFRANFGIFCSTPGIALSRCVGRKAAARMLLTGMSINAEEAYKIGLVSKVCEEHELGLFLYVSANKIQIKKHYDNKKVCTVHNTIKMLYIFFLNDHNIIYLRYFYDNFYRSRSSCPYKCY